MMQLNTTKAEVNLSVLPALNEFLAKTVLFKVVTFKELSHLLEEFDKNGPEWRESAENFKEVKVILVDIKTTLVEKVDAYIQENIPPAQEEIMDKDACASVQAALTSMDELYVTTSMAFRMDDDSLQLLDRHMKPVRQCREDLGTRMVYSELFEKPMFKKTEDVKAAMKAIGEDSTLSPITTYQLLEAACKDVQQIMLPAPNEAYEKKLSAVILALTGPLESIVKKNPDDIVTIRMLAESAKVSGYTIGLLGDDPHSAVGRGCKGMVGWVENYKWGLAIRVAFKQVVFYEEKKRTSIDTGMRALKKVLVDPPAPSHQQAVETFKNDATEGLKKVDAYKASQRLVFIADGLVHVEEMEDWARILSWQTPTTSTWEHVKKQIMEVLWEKDADGMKILKCSKAKDAVGIWSFDMQKAMGIWGLQSDSSLKDTVESVNKAIKNVNVIITESGYMSALTTNEGNETELKSAVKKEDSLRKDRGVLLTDVHQGAFIHRRRFQECLWRTAVQARPISDLHFPTLLTAHTQGRAGWIPAVGGRPTSEGYGVRTEFIFGTSTAADSKRCSTSSGRRCGARSGRSELRTVRARAARN